MLPSHSSISHMKTRSVPAGPGWLWLPLRGGVAGEFHPSARSHNTSTSWNQLTGAHTPSGHINPWMGGQPRCCVGPTLPLLSPPPQTRVTAPCCTTTATSRRPWAPPAPTPPPTPTRRAPGTPIACCPARTQGAPHRTSPSKSGYVSQIQGWKTAFINLSLKSGTIIGFRFYDPQCLHSQNTFKHCTVFNLGDTALAFDVPAFDFSDGSTVGAPRLPTGRGPGARAWGRAPCEAQDEKHLRLPSGGVRPPRLRRHRAAVRGRQRPQKQGSRLPMNDWQAEVPLISQRHRLALTSRTSKQIKI